ncbi:hypothetical protein QOZ80_2AG0128160 [Eleusine coracana subsp. coracana]|nr:hypothetical protein QOZ80_2AG0128160 [Eleusine coracana subsp. coracana]
MARRITAMAAVVAVMALLLLLLPVGQAEARPTEEEHPHGLPYESPLALSPAAYEFFHPSARRDRARQAAHGGAAPALAPRGQQQLRESVVKGAVARADQEEGGVAPVGTARHGGAFRMGKVAGVIAGAAAVALVAVGVAYAVARRRLARGGVTTEAEAAGPHKSIA